MLRTPLVTRFASPNWDTFEFASGTCGPAQENVHIWVSLGQKSQLYGADGRLESTLLAHEVFHLLGSPGSHDWPCTDGSVVDESDCCVNTNIPALMFGWTDTDRDGIPRSSTRRRTASSLPDPWSSRTLPCGPCRP